MDKAIALTAAKREAEIRDLCCENPEESEMKQRRRWDCIHVATAQVLECSRLYTTDQGMMARATQLKLSDLKIIAPVPTKLSLDFDSRPALALVTTTAPSS